MLEPGVRHHVLRSGAWRMIARSSPAWTHGALPWWAVAIFVALNLAAAVIGSQQGRTLDEQEAQNVRAEDGAVCARLSAPPGSEHFVGCIIELDLVRQQERRRLAERELAVP